MMAIMTMMTTLVMLMPWMKAQAKPFYLTDYNLHDSPLGMVLLILMMLLMMILMRMVMRMVRMAMTLITGAKPFCPNPHIPIRGEIGPSFLS